MLEFLVLVLITLIAPIFLVAIALSLFIVIHSLLKGRRPEYSKIRDAFASAVLLELLFLGAIIIAGIIFSPRASGGGTYAFPVLFFGTAVVGVGGFLYFVIRVTPRWCQWGTWWKFIFGHPSK